MDLVGQGGQRESADDCVTQASASPAQLATGALGVTGDLGVTGALGVKYSRVSLFLALGISGCAIDLFTKHLAFTRIGSPPSPIYWVWDGFFGFQTSVNHGALFGMGQGNVALFATVSIVALAGLLMWIFKGGALNDLGLTVALGMILGGILGNLYDRLGMWGHAGVRDWILCCYKDWVWPNFNIADSLLVCGAILMMWQSWREEAARAGLEKERLEKEPS